ncbi:Arm DNA-binding domain-containing protein [Paraburkholderia sp. CNPSo 3272]|uniref:Arm DNA-binding domain-containing protein n=1 Tax=Paraburkholderia sp. CNPSo 3272 TaxID=2940931 RepID=UPI0028159A21|nr:Arm DNA-binding domain-containing protein [Paraburkholderia sp. CNPSo 3272]
MRPGDKPVFDGKVTGLMLVPGKTCSKWILRFSSPVTHKRRDAGLGVYPEVSILDARNKALAMRTQLDAGKIGPAKTATHATLPSGRSPIRFRTRSKRPITAQTFLNSAARSWKRGRRMFAPVEPQIPGYQPPGGNMSLTPYPFMLTICCICAACCS